MHRVHGKLRTHLPGSTRRVPSKITTSRQCSGFFKNLCGELPYDRKITTTSIEYATMQYLRSMHGAVVNTAAGARGPRSGQWSALTSGTAGQPSLDSRNNRLTRLHHKWCSNTRTTC
jgi:hypothetical protein